MTKDIINELLRNINFDENKTTSQWNNSTLVIDVWTKLRSVKCPDCFSTDTKPRGSRIKESKHTSKKIPNILLRLRHRQFKCLECDAYFLEEIKDSGFKPRSTLAVDMQILEDLLDFKRTYSEVARNNNVSPTYVQKVFDRHIDVARLPLSNVICLDEVYTKRITKKKYCLVIFCFERKKIIDIVDSRRTEDLNRYFSQISLKERETVTHVCTDMHEPYKIIIKKFFPNAIIIIDSFHVIQNLNRAFNKVRIRIMRKYEGLKYANISEYWYFKSFWRLLMGDIKDYNKLIYVRRYKMTIPLRQIIEYMLKVDKELELAYLLKEEYRNFNSLTNLDKVTALNMIDEFYLKFRDSGIHEFYDFCTTIYNWKFEIANSFERTINKERISNGPLERLNKDIKLYITLAYGARNFQRFRNRIMYSRNKDTPIKFKNKNRAKY